MKHDEIFLINKLFEISKKLNKNIKISSKEDAANLYAYIKGYSSWSEMLLYEKVSEQFKPKPKEYKEKTFHDKVWEYENRFKESLLKTESRKKSIPIKEKTNLLDFFQIGKQEILKTLHPVALEYKNTLISSDLHEGSNAILEEQISDLLKWQKSFILCGVNNKKNQDNLLKKCIEHNVRVIGKNHIKLNPLLDLFEFEAFEDFFVEAHEENVFEDIWVNLIRVYREQLGYEITLKLLKESLKIENLLQMITGVEKNISLQFKPLLNYINKYLDVKYQKENASFILSKESQAKHYRQIFNILEKIRNLEQLYEEDFFDEKSKFSMSSLLNKKEPIVILDCEKMEIKQVYWDIIFNNLSIVMKEQEIYVESTHVSEKKFEIPLIVWGSDNIISNQSTKVIIENSKFLITYLYDLEPNFKSEYEESLKEIFIKNCKQILFLRQNLHVLPREFEFRLKNNTIEWQDNFFFNQFDCLRNLKNNEGFIWCINPNEVKMMSDMENYVFRKVLLNAQELSINE